MSAAPLPPGLILAGGRSARMGLDKALADLGGEPLFAHAVRRLAPQVSALAVAGHPALAVAGHPALAARAGLPCLDDAVPGRAGPLAGILAGLEHAKARHPAASHLLTAPVDSPFLPEDLGARLGERILTPRTVAIAASNGRLHPVFGLWPVALAGELAAWLGTPENRRITAFLDGCNVTIADFPPAATDAGPLDPFLNVNTPEDLERAGRFAATLAR